MKSAGANQLIEAVERITGFKVIVDTIEGITEDAQMISARPEMSVHSIRVSKAKLPYADYIARIRRTSWPNHSHIAGDKSSEMVCLGVGEYNFAPFKVVWEAYGKTNFRPRIFGSHNGKPWQANQAMQAFIPCCSLAEAEELLDQMENSNIESYLKSLSVEGTCNWAQPGRIKRFLQFTPAETRQEAFELQL